jgi:hypothetical protein
MSRNAAALSRRLTHTNTTNATTTTQPGKPSNTPPVPTTSSSPMESVDAAPAGSAAATGDTSRAVSEAFRTIALLWILMRRRVCQLTYMLVATHCLFASVLWQQTGDLVTPLTCCTCCLLVELWLTQWEGERLAADSNMLE